MRTDTRAHTRTTETLALGLALIATSTVASAQPTHACASDALKQGKKLLEFHAGPDDRIEIEPKIKVPAPIKNPAGKDR